MSILLPLTSYLSPLTSYLSPLYSQTQTGKASFYAKRATGSRTANGERLHHDSLTCAHRTLPFGTLLRVTNPANDRSVIVRVNDRGPYVRGRIIDLSWGAARELGMITQGIASVIVERVTGNDILIPMKASHRIEIPELSLEVHQTPDALKPVWQEDLEIDHKKVQRAMKRTAQKSLLQRLQEAVGW